MAATFLKNPLLILSFGLLHWNAKKPLKKKGRLYAIELIGNLGMRAGRQSTIDSADMSIRARLGIRTADAPS